MTGAPDSDDAAVAAELTAELARLTESDPLTALRLPPEAAPAEIRAAFLALTRSYHPNRFARRSAEVARLANEVYLRIKTAYGRLTATSPRADGAAELRRDPQPPPLERPSSSPPVDPPAVPTGDAGAELRSRQRAARQRAMQRHAERTGRTAEQPVLPAVGGPAAEEQTRAEEARRRDEEFAAARRLLARGEFAAARRELHRLAVADPQRKELRVYLHLAWGREHEAAGDGASAAAEYNRALKLDPGFEPARAAAELLQKKSKSKGIFDKLFRK